MDIACDRTGSNSCSACLNRKGQCTVDSVEQTVSLASDQPWNERSPANMAGYAAGEGYSSAQSATEWYQQHQ